MKKQKQPSLFDEKPFQELEEVTLKFFKKNGSIPPAVFLKFSKKDSFQSVPMISDEKQKFFAGLGQVTKDEKIVKKYGELEEALFISDTYFIKAGKEENVELPVRDNPQKKEALMFTARNKDNSKNFVKLYPYERDGDKIKLEKPETDSGLSQVQGLLDFLFTPGLINHNPEYVN